ncbi:hypothetical protein V3C99_012373 [Haemonchus contortus]|uniref:Lipoprotein n=1 Tax=Haemonchus contortus TaxID=6289 RepID=A0A7I4Y5K3_HAECO
MVTVTRILVSLLSLLSGCLTFDMPNLRMLQGKERSVICLQHSGQGCSRYLRKADSFSFREILGRTLLTFQRPRLDLIYRDYQYPPDRSASRPMVVFDGRVYPLSR